jgi:hypothetical protein
MESLAMDFFVRHYEPRPPRDGGTGSAVATLTEMTSSLGCEPCGSVPLLARENAAVLDGPTCLRVGDRDPACGKQWHTLKVPSDGSSISTAVPSPGHDESRSWWAGAGCLTE